MALDLTTDLISLTRSIVDVESVSGNERELADLVQAALEACPHLEIVRDGDCVVARTRLGRPQRVVIAGHLDTVPVADNLPSLLVAHEQGMRIMGRGSCDMKGGVAVALHLAATLNRPNRDITWIFYDQEEVDAERNGLGRLFRHHEELAEADFAVLMEPTSAQIEGGCQGSCRVEISTEGLAAHSARWWRGRNAIHELAPVLARLNDYRPREIEVDALVYREGLNAVRIDGGVAGNVIPPRGRVEVNYRFAPDKSPEQAISHLREVFEGYDMRVTDQSPPARPGLDQPIAVDFVAAVGAQAKPKYGWTDVARFSQLGIPAVNYGPGDPSVAHSDEEFCPVADLEQCAGGLRRWLEGTV